jgi:hypothetical protein
VEGLALLLQARLDGLLPPVRSIKQGLGILLLLLLVRLFLLLLLWQVA